MNLVNIVRHALLVFLSLVSLQAAVPFGWIDTPAAGATGLAGAINVTGWALESATVAPATVSIYRQPIASLGEGPNPVFISYA